MLLNLFKSPNRCSPFANRGAVSFSDFLTRLNKRIPLAGLALGVIGFQALSAIDSEQAYAQTPYLPAVEIADGASITPFSAWTYFSGLSPVSNVDPNPRHDEIKSLARALRYDIDLIYEHIRNTAHVTPIFGLQKGAVGVILDGHGTPFDQAHLMVELLREADAVESTGYNAKYQLGRIQLTGAQFEEWFGITDSDAAAAILSDGGFPANVVDDGQGNVSQVNLMHIWVEATVGGQTYAFDPSYKPHDFLDPINLSSAMNYSQSALLTAAGGTTGTDNGVPFVHSFNVASFENKLQDFAEDLTTDLRTNHANKAPEEVLGGRIIQPYVLVDDGTVRDSQPGPYTWKEDYGNAWTNHIPDEFRTKVRLQVTAHSFDETLFADEFYGELLGFYLNLNATTDFYFERDSVGMWETDTTGNADETLEITIDHPYAASSGAYLDTDLTKILEGNRANYVSFSFGHFSAAHLSRISRELSTGPDYDPSSMAANKSNITPYRLTQQYSRLTDLIGRISESTVQHHHSVSVFRFQEPTTSGNDEYRTVIADVEGAYSVNTNDANAAKRTAVSHTLVAALNAIEANQSEQSGSIHSYAPISLFNWEATETGPKRFFEVDSSNVAAAENLVINYTAAEWDHIEDYASAGYTMIVPHNGTLGDAFVSGLRTAAFLAVDSNDSRIAYVSVSTDTGELIKGAGGGVATEEDTLNQIAQPSAEQGSTVGNGAPSISPADGSFSFTAQPDLVVGSGSFPHQLTFQRNYSSNRQSFQPHVNLHHGWQHNWFQELGVTSDADAALGSISAIDAAATVTALLASIDLLTTSTDFDQIVLADLAQYWFTRHILDNAVSITHGISGGSLFVRGVDGEFRSPLASIATLEQTGTITDHSIGRRDYSDLSFVYTSPEQDEKEYVFFNPAPDAGVVPRFWLDKWTFPTGMEINLEYGTVAYAGFNVYRTLKKVSNNLGHEIEFYWVDDFWDDDGDHTLRISDSASREVWFVHDNALTYMLGTTPHEQVLTDVANNTWKYKFAEIPYVSGTGKASCTASSCDYSGGGLPWRLSYFSISEIYSPTNAIDPVLEIAYDQIGKAKTITDRDNNVREFFSAGSRGSVKDPLDTVLADEDVSYLPLPVVGGAGSLRSVSRTVDALGNVTTSYTDGIGRATKIINPEGGCTVFGYDAKHNPNFSKAWPKPIGMGNVCADNDPDLDPIETSATFANTNFPASATSTFDAKNTETVYTYDIKGQLTKTEVLNAGVAGTTDNIVTTFDYSCTNSLGRPCKITDSEGRETVSAYDAISATKFGELITVTVDPTGINRTTTLDYDDVGNITKITEPDGTYMTAEWDDRRLLERQHSGQSSGEESVMEWKYDDDGRLIEQCQADPALTVANSDPCLSSPKLTTTVFTYDDRGQLEKIFGPYNPALPDGHDLLFNKSEYDELGRISIGMDQLGRKAKTVYDKRGQIEKVVLADGVVGMQQDYMTSTYSDNGNQLSLKDAKGNTTNYVYDGFDRLIKTTFPDGSCEELVYDDNNNITTFIKRDGSKIVNTYDLLNRMTKKETFANTSANHDCGDAGSYNSMPDDKVEYDYDETGRPTSIDHNGSTEITYTYDTAGRILTETQGLGTVSYTYRPSGCLEDVKWPDGFKTRSNCDGLKRAWQIKAWKTTAEGGGAIGQLQKFFYDDLSRRTEDNHLNNKQTHYDYHTDSMLKTLDQRNAWWNGTDTFYESDFTYTDANELSAETLTPASYVWEEPALETTDYQSNNLNQYTSVDPGTAVVPEYDLNGNLTEYDNERYEYDVENRLIKYERDDSLGVLELTVDYEYDGLGRRIKKTVKEEPSGPTTVTQYLYDGIQVIGEYDDSSTPKILRRYIYNKQGGPDEIYAFVDEMTDGSGPNRAIYYYHKDARGSVIAVTSASGLVVDDYAYSAFGVDTDGQDTTGQPYRYTGRRFDEETGLYYYRARYYHSEMGRFLQVDPIGYVSHMNLYGYVRNNPTNLTDPLGLKGAAPCQNAIAGDGPCQHAFSSNDGVPGVVEFPDFVPPEIRDLGVDWIEVTRQTGAEMLNSIDSFFSRVNGRGGSTEGLGIFSKVGGGTGQQSLSEIEASAAILEVTCLAASTAAGFALGGFAGTASGTIAGLVTGVGLGAAVGGLGSYHIAIVNGFSNDFALIAGTVNGVVGGAVGGILLATAGAGAGGVTGATIGTAAGALVGGTICPALIPGGF